MILYLDPAFPPHFPPIEMALTEPDGLLAVGGALTPDWIITAYQNGIFPWFNQGDPILWWSPNPRMVLAPHALKVQRSLDKVLRNKPYTVTVDRAFSEVMTACAAPRKTQKETWISTEMIEAYTQLHQLGYAHSVETWRNGQLIGGLYGISLGKMFYGESMFSRETDASKIAFVHLVRQLEQAGFQWIDCQVFSEHLSRLGAEPCDRAVFIQHLKAAIDCPAVFPQFTILQEGV